MDGYTLVNGDRLLIKNEATTANNGIYTWATGGTVLTRATDFDTAAEMASGDFTFVTNGTLYAGTGWVQTNPVAVVGTSPVTWAQFSGTGTYTAGTGLTLTGTQFSLTNPVAVTLGGTGLAIGTSGGVPYFSGTTAMASSALLANNAIMLGGGAGAAPKTTTTGTGVVTALGVNTGSAGAVVLFNGALGTPSSGTVTNLTGTASININGTVGATTANSGAFTTLGFTGALTGGTAAWAIGTNQIIKDTSGNVGIGVTPSSKFHVLSGTSAGDGTRLSATSGGTTAYPLDITTPNTGAQTIYVRFGSGTNNTNGGSFIAANLPSLNESRLIFGSNSVQNIAVEGVGWLNIGLNNVTGSARSATAPLRLYTGTATYTDNTTAASGFGYNAASIAIGRATLGAANASVTYDNTASLYIDGPLIAGTNVTLTNAYSLRIAAGDSLLGERIGVGTVPDAAVHAFGNGGAGGAALKLGQVNLLATAEEGAIEFVSTVFYADIAASTRAAVVSEQVVVLNTAYTLTSQTAAQKLFNATATGAVTLPVGNYFFECFYSLSAMSATSGSFGFALGGTATFTQRWMSTAQKGTATLATATATQSTSSTAANTTIATASVNTVGYAFIKGYVNVTATGTIIPQVSLGIAAAAVVGVGSYFKLYAVSATGGVTNISIGNWS